MIIMKLKTKRILYTAGIAILAICAIVFFIHRNTKPSYNAEDYVYTGDSAVELEALVLYPAGSSSWRETYSLLSRSSMASMRVTAAEYDEAMDLSAYTLIYPTDDMAGVAAAKDTLTEYVKGGGNLFLTNAFMDYFEPSFLGIRSLVHIDRLPDVLIPSRRIPADLEELQELICDYYSLYTDYSDIAQLKNRSYGYGAVMDTGIAVVETQNGDALYGLNKYHRGTVFWSSSLLPNTFHISATDMQASEDAEQSVYVNTDTTANRLIRAKFAAYVSKTLYGHAIERVAGSYGHPAIAWQLYCEDITGIENDAAITFAEICKEYNQIPSYTLIRNSYKRFARYETVTYMLNNNGIFNTDYYDSAYTSGKHIAAGDTYLRISEFDDRGSYFTDYPEYIERAYPCIYDIDGDGIADIIIGSNSGYLYFCKGQRFEDSENPDAHWQVSAPQILTNAAAHPIGVESYSAPDIMDVDGDGIADIISGCADGNIYWFKGTGISAANGVAFEEMGVLLELDGITYSMPAVGNIGGRDAYANTSGLGFAVGSAEGRIVYCKKSGGGYGVEDIAITHEGFAAPHIYDTDGDGENDLLIGTADGYIRILRSVGGKFIDVGFIETDETNYKGNNRVKFGNNCVPRLYDINGDGQSDLVAGSLEYGLAIPIDSPYFPLKSKLAEQVQYMKDNNFYLGMHYYTNEYASEQRQRTEIELHKKAMEYYGIDTANIGVNQHTWFISRISDTFGIQRESELLWNSGFRAAGSIIPPESTAESVLSAPYFMDSDNRDMLIFNTTNVSALTDEDTARADIAAKYNLPVSVYHHCDLIHTNYDAHEYIVSRVGDFIDRNKYSMVREDQLAKSAAASLNMYAEVIHAEDGFSVIPMQYSQDFPLYDENFANAAGYKISFSKDIDIARMAVSAAVCDIDLKNNCIYTAGTATVSSKTGLSSPHIVSVNLPANIDGGTIEFLEGGYMQVVVSGTVEVHSSGKPGDEWTIRNKDGRMIISKFGKAQTLELTIW